MYSSYYCIKCDKPFAKVGGLIYNKKGKVINPAICPNCESKEDVLTYAEYCEAQHVLEEKKNESAID